MNDLFKILIELQNKKVPFCLQSQGTNNYYNLSVTDIYGKQHHLHGNTLLGIEKSLKVIWGHLLSSKPMGFPAP